MLKKYIFAITLGVAMSSCGEDLMDRINEDTHHPSGEVVDAKFQVTEGIMSTVFSTLSGDYSFYVSSYTEQLFGTGNNQLMKAELRQRGENAAATTFNNVWNSTYGNLNNIKQMINKCEEGGLNQGQSDIKGMGEVLWVLNYAALTDMHGDIPYSEALSSMQPKLDSQESIYNDLLAKIDLAISDLSDAVAGKMNNAGAQDILFSGDPQKWLGLAYAVKARLLLNTSYRNPSVFADVITAGQAALDAGFNGAALSVFNGVDCDNPWAAFFWSRYYTGANATMAELLISRDDPRYDVYAVDLFGTGIEYAPAGDDALAGMTESVGCPLWLDNGAAPAHIISLSEIHFTLAEAKARLGQDASSDFDEGIRASFADYSMSTGESLPDPSVYIASLTPSLEEIMVQKYIAQARDEQM